MVKINVETKIEKSQNIGTKIAFTPKNKSPKVLQQTMPAAALEFGNICDHVGNSLCVHTEDIF